MLSAAAQAQFAYRVDSGTATITRYIGPGGAVTIPDTIGGWPVTSIGEYAFYVCSSLTGVYFEGNAPDDNYPFSDPFSGSPATIYCLPGTTGWGATFSDRPTALWVLPQPVILAFGESFGVRTNQFGFIVSWATNATVVVEACVDLANPTWSAVGTNTLTGGSAYFSDPEWANYPARFYRLRWP